MANGGTLFLDEIGELPLNLQAKLLGVIRERTFERLGSVKTLRVGIRIVAATNKDLVKACQDGPFRPDLFYRLNVVPVSIPPLRERKEDVVPLAEYFIHRLENRYRRRVGIPDEILDTLIACDRPGNIRELENVMERMYVLPEGPMLDPKLLPVEMRSGIAPSTDSSFKSRTEAAARGAEKRMIVDALNATGQNRTRAAKIPGISRRTLQSKIKDFDL